MKIYRFLAVAALALCLSACNAPDTKFSKTVDSVIERADRMSDKDWERTDKVLERMLDNYKANPDRLSDEEWMSVNLAYAKYNAAKAKHGAKKAAEDLGDIIEDMTNK